MKIVIASDAWQPQVNGVVRSLSITVDQMRRFGHKVDVIEPGAFWTVPCPTYPEIRLALGCRRALARRLGEIQPDRIHISTEGPIGWAARSWCLKHKRHFTTAFHTRFPDYVSIRTGISDAWVWKIMRRFHGTAERTFTATATLAEELHAHGLVRTHHWPRGVDLGQFNPSVPPHPAFEGLPRPIMLNVGRVAVEKNIEAFLSARVPGSKVVVGVVEGPKAISVVRNMMGTTNAAEALPGTIRGDYALEIGFNIVHGSDGPETAKFEVNLFFKAEELVNYELVTAPWIYE